MESQKDRTTIIAVTAGAIALLLGLCLGTVGGGAAGYLIGRQVEGRAAPAPVLPTPELPRLVPTPESPILPNLPGLPRGFMPVTGALVREVVAGSAAEKAGVQLWDVITGVDDTPIDANHDLADVLGTFKPGDRVELQVWRMGNALTLNVTLAEHPDNAGQAYLGLRYVTIQMQQRRQAPQD